MRRGFTLAELLIALTVVGVLAILTLPSLTDTYKFKLYSTQFNRAFAQISMAASQVIIKEHANNPIYNDSNGNIESISGFYTTEAGNDINYFLKNYIKGKICTTSCFAPEYKKYTAGTIAKNFEENFTKGSENSIKTVSGASICINNEDGEYVVYLDVNGELAPNIVGYDMFVMKIDEDGTIVDLGEKDDCSSTGDDIKHYASGCVERVINKGNAVTKF